MKKKQPNTQQSKNVQNNIKKLSSIKATVTYVLLGSIILTVILSLYIIIPSVQQNVTSITEKQVTVQYHPGIGNVTNHFHIPVSEAAANEWEIRWSADMANVFQYNIGEGQEMEKESEARGTDI